MGTSGGAGLGSMANNTSVGGNTSVVDVGDNSIHHRYLLSDVNSMAK